jgi:DNA-binding transcriptional MerR regulator
LREKLLRSGQLAKLAGVSPDLLRHYERIGVLPCPMRASNGYRVYPAKDLSRVRTVRRSLAIGFSLAELARIFATRDRGGVPCRHVRALAAEKLKRVEQSLEELRSLRRQLREILKDWDIRLAKTRRGQRAGLLESLAQEPAGRKLAAVNLRKGFQQ